MSTPRVLEVPTARGPARVHLHEVPGAGAALVMGHGAGGGVGAPDLVAVTEVALAAGIAVALVEQPYRVAGRRGPDRAPVLDAAWAEVVGALRDGPLAGLRLVTGGRSSGARVACRTADTTEAAGVLCLAFPLQPATRAGAVPRPSRLPELEAVTVPVLIVQGDRDPFGMPPEAPGRLVARVPGDHSLRKGLAGVRDAVAGWLPAVAGRGAA
ncbi:MAG: alpha/beta family hydrolase [Thermoleophilia bacterium]